MYYNIIFPFAFGSNTAWHVTSFLILIGSTNKMHAYEIRKAEMRWKISCYASFCWQAQLCSNTQALAAIRTARHGLRHACFAVADGVDTAQF